MLHYPFWKKALVIMICLLGAVIASPNLIDREARERLPAWMPSQGMNLGLDLQGGAHLLVETRVEDVWSARMTQVSLDLRQALSDAGVTRRGVPQTQADGAILIEIPLPEEQAKAQTALEGLSQPIDGSLGGARDLSVTRVDDRTFRVALSDAAKTDLAARTLQQSLEVVRRRVDPDGTTEATITRQGDRRILIQVPGAEDADAIKALIGDPAVLSFHTVNQSVSQADLDVGIAPAGYKILPEADNPEILWAVSVTPLIAGTEVATASQGFDSNTNEPIVAFRFTTAAGKKFADFTRANVGNPFAIVLDGKVLSAPRVNEPIMGGSGQITGNYTVDSAQRFATQISAGALPASMEFLEERTVGPELGADSIDDGKKATYIASALVVVFMIVMYGLFGVMASVAVAVNVVLIFAIMSVIGATLTLPGIAGVVLTIAFAVDANVLIYERIREELKAGKSMPRAIDLGFEKALAAVVDANITTLIAAGVLYSLGAGPVRGFAVTLAIGVATSMFTAVNLTRLMVVTWYNWKRPKTAKIALFHMVPDGTKFRFMKIWRPALIISTLLTIGAIAILPIRGVNMGIDFAGGAVIQVRVEPQADVGRIREVMNGLNVGEVAVQGFGDPRDVMVRVAAAEDEAAMNEVVRRSSEALAAEVPGLAVQGVDVVGPKVSGEFVWTGVAAIGVSLLGVMIYLWLRFEWQFAVGAAVATLHDVAVAAAILAITGVEYNLTLIAALLTLLGFSLNDTVVIYDRIRENLRKYKQMSLSDLIDLSLNETLSRTLMTTFTTLLALVGLYFFAGETLRGFSLTMFWGCFIGVYSSIYIAAPMLLLLGVKRDWSKEAAEKAAGGPAGIRFGGDEPPPASN
ncbi:protein translocase subunit SecD [Neomegalonema sp.]|uniref:protein translocase subunit SecD n=1 Tax=Neomegalonema sp. TaxID=2039713 RepID=UPI00260F2801|nr:protein translocase subunit SecD [Neomegalonema sp.]MDD2868785.1 protein translocase subunit SecD [Neomegalonema sp.]